VNVAELVGDLVPGSDLEGYVAEGLDPIGMLFVRRWKTPTLRAMARA